MRTITRQVSFCLLVVRFDIAVKTDQRLTSSANLPCKVSYFPRSPALNTNKRSLIHSKGDPSSACKIGCCNYQKSPGIIKPKKSRPSTSSSSPLVPQEAHATLTNSPKL